MPCAMRHEQLGAGGRRPAVLQRCTRAKKGWFQGEPYIMTCTSDTVRTHLQRCRTLGEGLLKLCAHPSPYTGRTRRLFPSPQAASVRPRFEPTATPPSRATSRGCYRYANPPPQYTILSVHRYAVIWPGYGYSYRYLVLLVRARTLA